MNNENLFGLSGNVMEELLCRVQECRNSGKKIVLTQGTWDLVHIGHARYFEAAKKYGDILIVGVDSDEKVRQRKGPDRPVVPEDERLEMVLHTKYVDFAIVKPADDPKWHLTKTIAPDILIATREMYSDDETRELEKYCGKVVILDPQATTSTSAKVRRLQLSTVQKLEKILIPKFMKAIEDAIDEIKNEKRKK